MAVLLAFGMVADRNRRAWLVETGEEIDHDGPEGAAVVLGDKDSDPARVAIACADLAGLIEIGGTVIAGAGIDLGEGFVSARLAGASGDRRDAVLAALRVLKVGGAWRLGERTATLVALFGVTATKPLGAAAEQAIGEGRWAAVVLASAAADVLGPEQLVRVLELRAPDGVDPVPDSVPSGLAATLRRVLEPYSGPRRVDLVLDLWEQVCARQLAVLARERLVASHDLGVLESLRERYHRFDESQVIELVQGASAGPLTLLTAIRFRPAWRNLWKHSVERLIQDALAATVLLRAAVAVHEFGVSAGIDRVRDEISVVSAQFGRAEIKKAQRPAGQLNALPGRPICHVHDIDAWLRQQQPRNAAFERFVRARLRTALAYAVVVQERCRTLFGHEIPRDALPDNWDSNSLRAWRAVAGHTAYRAPEDWHTEPLVRKHDQPSLAIRLAQDPTAVEQASDLLWLADLADAVARARGHEAAMPQHYYRVPEFDTNPSEPQPDPLTPRSDSIPLAVAGAAQLVDLGATVPERCRDWARLCAGLMGSGAVAAALTSEFEVAEPVLAHDGALLPGTALRIQLARTAARLAEWSDYMGNCIAGGWYQREAVRGRSILLALRDEHDVIQINVELRRTGQGWSVCEIAGRFNREPDPALRQAVRNWAATLRAEEPEADPVEVVTAEPPVRVRRSAPDPVREVGPVLHEAVRKALVESEPALRVLVALAGDDDGDPQTLTALRRSSAERLTEMCAAFLDSRPAALPALWAATWGRPLAAAVDSLEPALLARYPRLRTITADAPLPSKRLRALVKEPDIATARSMDLIALRARAAIGRLARRGDPALSRAVTGHPTPDVLCPLILATTCASSHRIPVVAISEPRAVTVPGFPITSLSDVSGPWQAAWPAALELGIDEPELGSDGERFWEHVAGRGLLIPAVWLPAGGWPALWSRAHAT
ncbi:hypothetical protein [Nocardia aurantiaca]|uniref:Uncharacterized protein n=1 Tax=Nocardia aurantiaca TaxID=2675850 RepID=A0A6I3L3E4_9NOCA|nr:hypothetical protein [Nocardia aurantiaca]MTE15818.1 hypothetical protein [Nocardia aurantiaca]